MATDPKKLKRLIEQATAAGVPRDQLENFTNARYVPLPWALPVHATARRADRSDGPLWIGLGGARGPGKSHLTFAQVGLDDCVRRGNLKALFLRQLQKSAAESMEDLAARIFRFTDADVKRDRIDFPNGSRIRIGGYRHARDIQKYLGIEYDIIAVEEATQLDEETITKMRGSLRTSRPDWRPRAYLTTNPGGIGHRWFKRNFVEPWRTGERHRFLGGKTVFFPANYQDNPFNDQAYVDYLESLTGALGRAWRSGDWDTFEGMAFPEWNYDIHTIDPITLPTHWPRWRAIDWGSHAPFGCLWFAKDLDIQRVYVYREAYQTQLTDKQQARLIKTMTPPDEQITQTFADPAMWSKRSYGDKWYTTADEYKDEGVPLTKADNDRMSGKRKVHNALALLPDGKPGLQVFRSCKNFIETFPILPSDPNKPEDVDTDAEDHLYDTLKYGLTNVKAQREPRNQRARQTNPMSGVRGL